jgi:hypothetical protein
MQHVRTPTFVLPRLLQLLQNLQIFYSKGVQPFLDKGRNRCFCLVRQRCYLILHIVYIVCKCGRVSPNTFHRATRWTPMVYGVSPVVGRLVRTLQDINAVGIRIPFHLLLSVCVIARPNVKPHTFGSVIGSLKFEIMHEVHWTVY